MTDICGHDQSESDSGWNVLGSAIVGEAPDDLLGRSLSLSSDGTIVAIGVPGNGEGHVRVYQYGIGSWIQLGGDIDGEDNNDKSGWSVSLSSDGTIVAIGAQLNDGSGIDSGHVRVYQFQEASGTGTGSGTWTKLGGDIDGEAAGDQSGFSLSLSSDGTIVAIGAHLNDGNVNNSGHVRVYRFEESSGTGTWTKLGGDIEGEGRTDLTGFSVSLSSNGLIVSVGAPWNDVGRVRVYQYEEASGTWIQLGGDIDGEDHNDNSGWSVSLSNDGTIVAIGAQLNDGSGIDSGHVRVYQFQEASGTWTKVGGDIDGEAAGDQSGLSVSLSSDGTIVAIGAIYNDGIGNDSGHVRVYQFEEASGSWTKLGDDIDGEGVSGLSGLSVLSLSSDGTTVAIGTPWNDSGHVRVYNLTLPEIKLTDDDEFKLVENKIPKCKIPDDHISRRVRGCGERVLGIPKQQKRVTRIADRIRIFSRYRRF
jgi:hypothetical protein